MDNLTNSRRSENMRRIRSTDTRPEMIVRKLVHQLGFRYRLHVRTLPGKPDLVFASKKRIILVHGCFWHQHSACREGRMPSSRTEYWLPKLKGNVARDQEHTSALQELGWKVLTIWECQTADESALTDRLLQFLQ